MDHIPVDELREFMRDKAPELIQEPQPQPAEQTKRKIVVGFLSYDGKMYCRTAFALMNTMVACAKEGWEFAYILREGDSMVARCRSFIASQFLENEETKDGTDLVMIDADLDWSADDFVKMCKYPVDVIGGAYPFKDDTGRFPLRWSSQGFKAENDLWNVQAVTPGFFRMTRHALERMAREMPWLEYHEHLAKPGHRTWMFFDNLARRNGVFDEGYIFCERWKALGGSVYLAPDFNLTHIGPKAFNFGSIRMDFEKKETRIQELHAKYPHVPLPEIVNDVMTRKEKQYDFVDDQHSNSVPSGALEGDDPKDTPEHQPEEHDADDLGGPGRSSDDQLSGHVAQDQVLGGLDQATRRQPRGQVRSRANGSAGRHLSAGG